MLRRFHLQCLRSRLLVCLKMHLNTNWRPLLVEVMDQMFCDIHILSVYFRGGCIECMKRWDPRIYAGSWLKREKREEEEHYIQRKESLSSLRVFCVSPFLSLLLLFLQTPPPPPPPPFISSPTPPFPLIIHFLSILLSHGFYISIFSSFYLSAIPENMKDLIA